LMTVAHFAVSEAMKAARRRLAAGAFGVLPMASNSLVFAADDAVDLVRHALHVARCASRERILAQTVNHLSHVR
jgi:hypothetical protein